MEIEDWVFWYTGAAVWSAIGMAVSVAVTGAAAYAVIQSNRTMRQFLAVKYFAENDIDEKAIRALVFESAGPLQKKDIDFSATCDFIVKLRKLWIKRNGTPTPLEEAI